jgi:hypothetical protein
METPTLWRRIAAMRFTVAAAVVGIAAWSAPVAAEPAAKPFTLELNKVETAGKGCRFYFVADNPTDAAVQSFKLDLIFFAQDGVIDRRLVVDVGPLRAQKKSVKTFEFDKPPCEQLGSILLNDVTECKSASGPEADCLQHLTVSSRAKVPFTK